MKWKVFCVEEGKIEEQYASKNSIFRLWIRCSGNTEIEFFQIEYFCRKTGMTEVYIAHQFNTIEIQNSFQLSGELLTNFFLKFFKVLAVLETLFLAWGRKKENCQRPTIKATRKHIRKPNLKVNFADFSHYTFVSV